MESNFTLDKDVFADFNTSTWPPSSSLYETIWPIVMDTVRFFVYLCALGASIFLVVIMLRFDRLKTRANAFLLHYAIACLMDNLATPILGIIEVWTTQNTLMSCINFQIYTSTSLLIFIFATATGLFWYLQNFRQEWVNRTNKFHVYFAGFLYLLYLIKLGVCFRDCFSNNTFFSKFTQIIAYVTALSIIVTINVLVHQANLTQRQQNTKYQLTVSTYVILSYFPLLACTVLYLVLEYVNEVLYNLVVFSEYLAYSSVIAVLYILGKKNKYFKSVYERIFKRSARGYEEDDLDGDDEDDNGQPNHTSGIVPTPALFT